MKFLKKNQLNFRNVKDTSVMVSSERDVVLGTTSAALIPKGTIAQRPSSPTNGQIRYNIEDQEFEFYRRGEWTTLLDQNSKIFDGNFLFTSTPFRTSSLNQVIVDKFEVNKFRSAKYQVQISNSATYEYTELYVIHDGTVAYISQLPDLKTNTISVGTFDVSVTVEWVNILFTPTEEDTKLILVKTLLVSDSSAYRSIASYAGDYNYNTTSQFTEVVTTLPAPVIIDTWPINLYRSAHYILQLSGSTGVNSSEIMVTCNNTDVRMNEYAITIVGSDLGEFYTQYNNGSIELVFTPYIANSTIKVTFVRTLLSNFIQLPEYPNAKAIIADENFIMNSFVYDIPLNSVYTLDTFNVSLYGSVRYQYQITNNIGRQTGELLISHDGISLTYLTQFANLVIGSECGNFNCSVVNDSVVLNYIPNSDNNKIILVRTAVSKNGTLSLIQDSAYKLSDSNFTLSSLSALTNSTSQVTLDDIDITVDLSCKYLIQLNDANGHQVCYIDLVHNGIDSKITVYANNVIGAECGIFDTTIVSNRCKLLFTPSLSLTNVIIVKTLFHKV